MRRTLRPGMVIELAAQNLGQSYEDRYGYASCIGPTPPSKEDKTYYPTLNIYDRNDPLDLPDSGKATVEYVVERTSVEQRNGGKKKHDYTLKIKSIDVAKDDVKKAKTKPLPGAVVKLEVLQPGMIQLAGRQRNADGEFAGNDGGGMSPQSTQAAYGQHTGGIPTPPGAPVPGGEDALAAVKKARLARR